MPKPRPGRPAKPYPRIPDAFENVIKALVQPVERVRSEKREKIK